MSNKKNDGKAHIYMKDGEVYVTIDGEIFCNLGFRGVILLYW